MSQSLRRSILVVGSVNQDLILETERMPLPGESLLATGCTCTHGGKGANQAVALARLGGAATFVGRVGCDEAGSQLITSLRNEGVDTSFMTVNRNILSGRALVFLEPGAGNSILVYPGANATLTTADLPAAFAAQRWDALLLQFEVPQTIVIESCHLASEYRIPVVLDAGPAQDFPLEQLRDIRVITPNETETLALTGIEVCSEADAERAAELLHKRCDAHAVVLKRGAAGAFLLTREGQSAHLAPPQVQAVDPTAAGDAFTAALVLRWLETGDLFQAVVYANFAGALAATRRGAQASLPTATEIDCFRAQRSLSRSKHV